MRKTFPQISKFNHPNRDYNSLYIPTVLLPPTKEDEFLAKEIIELYSCILRKQTTGEWSFIDNFKRKEYLRCLIEKDVKSLSKLLRNFFITDISYGLVSPSVEEFNDQNLDIILADLDATEEFAPFPKINDISSSKQIGNPFGLDNSESVILPDSPRHFYFASQLLNLSTQSGKSGILEIGGGYGGVISMLRKLKCNSPYINIDLPETGLICYYYLKKLGIRVEFLTDFVDDFKSNTCYIIPNYMLKLFNYDSMGVVFNSNSLSEMTEETIIDYFSFIQRDIKPDYIYHQNSNFVLFPESVRHIEIISDNFPINLNIYEMIYKMISPFHGGSGRYRIYLYKKIL
ncbi:MAG: putative sugar O-methyltransferase [Melioribacteraceae bacterium]